MNRAYQDRQGCLRTAPGGIELGEIGRVLEEEMPIASMDLNDEEEIMLRSFQFLTMKP